MRKILITAGVLMLMLAVGVQLRHGHRTPPGKGKHLARVLPMNPTGWTGKDVPLGATEEVLVVVEKTLQFEDVYFREFKTSRGIVSVYVAYWGPGKMPTQLVASHTPDRCWVENGWNCVEARHKITLSSGTTELRPGEWRVFTAQDSPPLHVQFWHLVGGETYDYGDRLNEMPAVWRWWSDAARQIFKTPPEQYFIRVTSERSFTELAGDPGWEELVAALAKLGLGEAPRAPKPEA
jgi:hypothetical protein